jgi:glutaredoxin 3
VKEYLSKKGIPFTEYDVAASREKAMEMVQKTRQMGVPVIVIDDKDIVIGFDQPKLDKLLAAPAGGAPQP